MHCGGEDCGSMTSVSLTAKELALLGACMTQGMRNVCASAHYAHTLVSYSVHILWFILCFVITVAFIYVVF